MTYITVSFWRLLCVILCNHMSFVHPSFKRDSPVRNELTRFPCLEIGPWPCQAPSLVWPSTTYDAGNHNQKSIQKKTTVVGNKNQSTLNYDPKHYLESILSLD